MMIHRIVLPFAATVVLLAGAPSAHCQQDPQPERLTTQLYDVRDLVSYETLYLPNTALDAPYVQTEDVASDNPIGWIEIADLVSLLREASGPNYWGQEGVEMRAEDSGFLAVRSSGAMHANLDKALVQLRRLLLEQVLVEVHELPAAAIDGQRSVLSDTDAKALLQRVSALRRYVGRATISFPLLLESTQVQNRVSSLRMQVAENTAVPDPVIETRGYGASWLVQVSRTTGDAMLVSFSGNDRSLEPDDRKRAVPTGSDEHQATLPLSAIRAAAFDASVRLLPGQALLIGSNTPAGKVLCVRVRRIGPPIDPEIGGITAYPIRTLVSSTRCSVRGLELRVPNEDAMLFPEIEEERVPPVLDEGRLQELITSTINPDTWDGSPHTMNLSSGMLWVRADAETCESIGTLLRSLEAIDGRQYSLEVRFGDATNDAMSVSLTDGADELAASLPHRCLSTLSASRGTRLSATRHTPVIRDYDTSIASGVGVTTPVVGSVADGFLLRGDIANMDSRFVRLNLHLTIAEDKSGRAALDLQDKRLGKVDQIDVRENRVRGTCTVELGKWTLMQLAPVQGTDRHIAIVARVTAL